LTQSTHISDISLVDISRLVIIIILVVTEISGNGRQGLLDCIRVLGYWCTGLMSAQIPIQ
jgi:hypothetical protein